MLFPHVILHGQESATRPVGVWIAGDAFEPGEGRGSVRVEGGLPADHAGAVAALGALHESIDGAAEQAEAEAHAGTGEYLAGAFVVWLARDATDHGEPGGDQGDDDIAGEGTAVELAIIPLEGIDEEDAGSVSECGGASEGVG